MVLHDLEFVSYELIDYVKCLTGLIIVDHICLRPSILLTKHIAK